MGSEYTANMPVNMPVIPTGADVKFYQTLTGGPTYEVRFRGVNPFTGIFTDDEPLSVGNLQVGSYAGGNPTLAAVMPMGGAGAFMPYGDAPYFTAHRSPHWVLWRFRPAASPASRSAR